MSNLACQLVPGDRVLCPENGDGTSRHGTVVSVNPFGWGWVRVLRDGQKNESGYWPGNLKLLEARNDNRD